MNGTTRRDVLRLAVAAGGAMMIKGCANADEVRMRDAIAGTGAFQPNMYMTITRDDRVLMTIEKSEMGQGVFTGYAMLCAEELEVPLSAIEVSSADGAPEYRTSNGMQVTGGSTSTPESFIPVRKAAAAAREMLVRAAARTWGVKRSECVAENGAVKHPPSGRSLRYGELTHKAARLPIPEDVKLKSREDFKVIGTPARRVDARAKVDGSGVFGIDVQVPNMVKAYVIRPPVFGAPVDAFEAAEAKQMTGVIDIFVIGNGVAVVAEKYWQARRAAPKVKVTWGRGQTQGLDTEAIRAAAKKTKHKGRPFRQEGEMDGAFDGSGLKVIEAIYEAPYLAHAPMEPQNAVAHVREDGIVETWSPNQAPSVIKEVASKVAGVARDKVIAHVTLLGGGFGRRAGSDFVSDAVEISMRVKRPAQVIFSREDDTRGGFYRPISISRVKAAINDTGEIAAWDHQVITQPILLEAGGLLPSGLPTVFPRFLRQRFGDAAAGLFATATFPDVIALEGAADTAYEIPNLRVASTPINTAMPTSFWRSVGHSYNGFVMEGMIDELAHAAGVDPVKFRLNHLKLAPRHRTVLKRAAEAAGWGKPTEQGFARGVAVHKSFGTWCAEVVEAGVIDDQIVIKKVTAAVDCGLAINPDIVRAQVESGIIFGLSAALKQQITMKRGQIQESNFDDFPLLRLNETPEIEVHIVESEEKPMGIGEPGLPPVAPALANALFAATGVRLRRMPFEAAWREQKQAVAMGDR